MEYEDYSYLLQNMKDILLEMGWVEPEGNNYVTAYQEEIRSFLNSSCGYSKEIVDKFDFDALLALAALVDSDEKRNNLYIEPISRYKKNLFRSERSGADISHRRIRVAFNDHGVFGRFEDNYKKGVYLLAKHRQDIKFDGMENLDFDLLKAVLWKSIYGENLPSESMRKHFEIKILMEELKMFGFDYFSEFNQSKILKDYGHHIIKFIQDFYYDLKPGDSERMIDLCFSNGADWFKAVIAMDDVGLLCDIDNITEDQKIKLLIKEANKSSNSIRSEFVFKCIMKQIDPGDLMRNAEKRDLSILSRLTGNSLFLKGTTSKNKKRFMEDSLGL